MAVEEQKEERKDEPSRAAKEERKEVEEKDPEVKKWIEQMEEDQSLLVVDPPKQGPKSEIYHDLNLISNNKYL
jgi:tRNA/tmRNA/rRNA uracil-C5-methylase (TrmA/RlmC/RlmD family)